jgi:hypothetical protein
VISFGLLSASALGAPAHASRQCAADTEASVGREVPALAVEVSAEQPAYRRRQIAHLAVQVRLAVPGGPKVSAAQVSVVLTSKDGHVVKELAGQTDAAGRALLSWRIDPRAPIGRLRAVATASVLLVDSFDCTGGLLYESGQGSADPLLTLTA